MPSIEVRAFQSYLHGIEILDRKEHSVFLMRSNRTFMELKSVSGIASSKSRTCSNRTFMELKLNSSISSIVGRPGSNRTFMELKLNYREQLQRSGRFQSYLHGIEIYMHSSSMVPRSEFQSYLHGIEIIMNCYSLQREIVPIVPSWN